MSMATNKRLILITGAFLSAFAIYILAFLLPDVIRSSVGPTAHTMSEAATIATESNAYVTITDGEWLCDTLITLRGRSVNSPNRSVEITRFTEVFRSDDTGAVVLLVTLSGEESCDTLPTTPVSGYLQRMSPDREQALINEVRLARFINATDFLELCAYCGPDNSLIGVIFGFVFAVGGIGLLMWGVRM